MLRHSSKGTSIDRIPDVQDFEYSDPSEAAQSPETFRSADENFDDRHDEGLDLRPQDRAVLSVSPCSA